MGKGEVGHGAHKRSSPWPRSSGPTLFRGSNALSRVECATLRPLSPRFDGHGAPFLLRILLRRRHGARGPGARVAGAVRQRRRSAQRGRLRRQLGAGSLSIADIASLTASDLPGAADLAWALVSLPGPVARRRRRGARRQAVRRLLGLRRSHRGPQGRRPRAEADRAGKRRRDARPQGAGRTSSPSPRRSSDSAIDSAR